MPADVQLIMSVVGQYPVLDIIAVFFAQYVIYLTLVIFCIALLTYSDWRRRLYVLFVSALSVIIGSGFIKYILNYAFYRPRPFVAYDITPLFEHTADASFPSGHATLMFTVATLIFLFMNKRWGIWVFAFAALVGLARVYAGVHYPLDILGGAVIGVISPFIARMILPTRLGMGVETHSSASVENSQETL